MPSLVVRPMHDADCERVSAVLRACFRWVGERESLTPRQLEYLLGERSSQATIRAEASVRPHLVACIGEAIVGMAAVNGQELARLYVDPAFHRRGIGRRLFDAVEEMIRAQGFGEMRVGALAEDAKAFYLQMGMQIVDALTWEPEVFDDRQVTILVKSLG